MGKEGYGAGAVRKIRLKTEKRKSME